MHNNGYSHADWTIDGSDVRDDDSFASLRKAAEQGDIDAQYKLGNCYYNGNGVSEDKAEAVKWYRKAAEQGNAKAQCKLGWCYYYGEGVYKDKAEAIKWYRQAAEQGDSMAEWKLKMLQKRA